MEKKQLIFLVAFSFFTLFNNFCFSDDASEAVIAFQDFESSQEEHSFLDENLTSTIDAEIKDDSDDEIDILELDLDDFEEEGLSIAEKMKIAWLIFKFKSGDHLKKYGKWYLCGTILTGAAIAVYFKFIKKD